MKPARPNTYATDPAVRALIRAWFVFFDAAEWFQGIRVSDLQRKGARVIAACSLEDF